MFSMPYLDYTDWITNNHVAVDSHVCLFVIIIFIQYNIKLYSTVYNVTAVT